MLDPFYHMIIIKTSRVLCHFTIHCIKRTTSFLTLY